jgi:hypothetical protein
MAPKLTSIAQISGMNWSHLYFAPLRIAFPDRTILVSVGLSSLRFAGSASIGNYSIPVAGLIKTGAQRRKIL